MAPIRVAVNGYGVIGKRVADAVAAQDDMELVGVSSMSGDYRTAVALKRGYPVYSALPDAHEALEAAGIPVAGTLDELLGKVDVVADCAPAKIGASNLARYERMGVRAIFQGGESHSLTGHSFVAGESYAGARGRPSTRVVSCNTTTTVRLLCALRNAGLLKRARGMILRRATDPWESHRSGIMNTVLPEGSIPSHQGPDARTVAPDLDVVTLAANASHTHGHSHYWVVELSRRADREEVLAALHADSRIAMIRRCDGLVALNSTQELMRDLGRPRGDMYEVAVWEDVLKVEGDELYFTCQVDNQAIVIPETIDAVRALTGRVPDAETSIALTNASLGVQQEFLASTFP